jgi:TonB family protein
MGGTVAEGEEEEPDLQMSLYSTQVRRYIRNYYAQRAAGCFDHESRVTGQVVRGTVVIGFTIGPAGRVQNATISRNTTGNAALGQCLQRNVASWELPAPPRGEPLEMEMPFSR